MCVCVCRFGGGFNETRSLYDTMNELTCIACVFFSIVSFFYPFYYYYYCSSQNFIDMYGNFKKIRLHLKNLNVYLVVEKFYLRKFLLEILFFKHTFLKRYR